MSEYHDAAACWDVLGDIRCQMGSAGERLRATLGLQFQLVKLVNLLHRLRKHSLALAIAVSELLARTSSGHRLNSRENPAPISAFASLRESNTQHRAVRQILTQSHAAGAGDCRLNSRWSVAAPGCQALSGNQRLWALLPMVTRMSARE